MFKNSFLVRYMQYLSSEHVLAGEVMLLYNYGCPAGADEQVISVLWSQPFRPAVLWLTELEIRLSKNIKIQLLLVV